MASSKTFDAETYAYPLCREQHQWTPHDGGIDNKAKLAFRIQKCAHCPTKKHTIISLRASNRGQILKSRMQYPSDYLVKGGLDRSDRGAIRLHNFLAEIGQ